MIITADIKLLPGVMALINGVRFYKNDIDVYLLYWDDKKGTFERQLDKLKARGGYAFLKLIDLEYIVSMDRARLVVHNMQQAKPKFYLKFWRHYFPEQLLDYNAIAIFDADMMIVNNIMQYFEVAAKTGRILIPRNTNIHATEIDNYSDTAFKASYAPPCHSMPLFYDPNRWYEFFQAVPSIALKAGRGEMIVINYLLQDLYDDLFLLPNSLWLGTRWKDLKYEILYGNEGMRHLTVAGDRAFSIHGRWWAQEAIDKIKNDGRYRSLEAQTKFNESISVGLKNGLLFKEMYEWLGQIYDG